MHFFLKDIEHFTGGQLRQRIGMGVERSEIGRGCLAESATNADSSRLRCHAVGHTIQPTGQSVGGPDRSGFASQDEKGRLKSVLGFVAITEHAAGRRGRTIGP